ncbi:MAG: WG repeat-containing protein [bacterium]
MTRGLPCTLVCLLGVITAPSCKGSADSKSGGARRGAALKQDPGRPAAQRDAAPPAAGPKVDAAAKQAPRKLAALVGGWLDSTGREILRKDDLVPVPFVTPNLASACRKDASGLLVDCRTVDRAGKLGAKLPGYLVRVLGGKGRRRLYLVEKDTPGREPTTRVGVVGSEFETVLEPTYGSVRCWSGCRRLIVGEVDDSMEVSKRHPGYCVPISEHQYHLLDLAGVGVRPLTKPLVVFSSDRGELLQEMLTVPDNAPVVPFRKNKLWGLLNPRGRVVLKPTYGLIKVISATQILGASGCRQEQGDVGETGSCSQWELLDAKGQPTGPAYSSARFPIAFLRGSVVALTKTACRLFRADDTWVDIANCSKLTGSITDSVLGFERWLPTGKSGWGLADKTGKILVEPKYSSLGFQDQSYRDPQTGASLDSGLVVAMMYGAAGRSSWGAIDQSGKVVVPLTWDALKLAGPHVFVQKDKLWGVLDRSGKVLVSPRYTDVGISEVSDRDDHQAPLVSVRKGKQGVYLDRAGKELIRGFDSLSFVSRTLLRAATAKRGALHSAITGARILPDDIHERTPTCLGPAQHQARAHPVAVKRADGSVAMGLVSLKGVVTRFQYDTVGCLRHGRAPFTIVNKKAKPATAPPP